MAHNSQAALIATSETIAVTDALSVHPITVIPPLCFLGALTADLDTIVTATTITWGIAVNANGNHLITDMVPVNIAPGVAVVVPNKGSANDFVGILYRELADSVPGSLFLVVQCNAGTCNMVVSLTCET